LSIKNVSLDIDYVRSQFPAFNDPLSSKWSFFENAGGSYVPQNVIDHLNNFMISTKVQPYASYDMSDVAGKNMDKAIQREIYADVLERLIIHLRNRTDVQNIDLMNLSGFCRNCLSKWYVNAAEKKNIKVDYDKARELIYGMPYNEWKNKYQKEVTKEQLEKLKEK